MNPACVVGDHYRFDVCCLWRYSDCFEAPYTFDFCCPGAARVAPYFGDPSCFQDETNFYNFERCCIYKDPECFDGVSFTPQRCCGEAAPASLTRLGRCQSELGKAVPFHLSQGNTGRILFFPFKKLTRVTALMLFSLIGAQTAATSFNASFDLMADSGLGLRLLLSNLKISSSGGSYVQREAQLKDPVDVFSLALRLRRWQGDSSVLHFWPRGCPAVSKSVALVHCYPRTNSKGEVNSGDLNSLQLMEELYDWLVILRHAEDPGACFGQLDVSLRELQAQRRLGNITIVLSPYLRSWHLQMHSAALWRLSQLISAELAVLGLPSAGNTFAWPLRRLRRQYWKLQAVEYPTGSARHYIGDDKGSKLCHGGDAVSASRVYKSSVLKMLLKGVKAASGAEWLLNLDLEALETGINHRTFLCAVGAFDEEDYLQHARLNSHISQRYAIEVARLRPGELTVNCAVTRAATVMVDEYFRGDNSAITMSTAGMVTSWCFRRSLRKAWRELTAWWSGLSPIHYVVPADGTSLSLLRNLEEPIPWDHDVDIWLYTPGAVEWINEVFSEQHRSEALDSLKRAGFRWLSAKSYVARGGGVHVEMQFLDPMDVGILAVDMDVVIKPYFPRSVFPLAVNLYGSIAAAGVLQIRFAAEKYFSARKLNRSGQPFLCSRPGHPSCIPASLTISESGAVASCEFADRFVLLDWFE
ncbi:unnamed protein product [Symbiodinium sp. CCMP2456]|nr:unnamed protein product [Symbiodinium sp. CCMP2456]